MINEELRKQLEELDTEFATPEPVVESQVDLLARLDDLEDKDDQQETTEIEETPRTGQFIVTFDEALIERDSAGRVVGLIGNGWRKNIGRDKVGRVVSVSTETEELVIEEVEEVTAPEE